MRTSTTSQSANKKQEFVKSDDKKVDEKKRDMRKVKCYNCNKEGHFAKDCKKAKFVANQTEKIDKYISGLPVNIYRSLKASKPKMLDETIELANDLMDQKL
nr:hypothetical protein [Tanacetum cinerariifolium]